MGAVETFVIGVGLSMDAFAASVCKGLKMRKINKAHCLVIALFFGGFQALMPLIGWVLGSQFAHYITAFDHWVAFGLLTFIGGKMIIDARKGGEGGNGGEAVAEESRLDLKELLLLAVATSIDALAVGISFAFLQVNIWSAIAIIGCTTFVISMAGVVIGNRFGSRHEDRAELAGGVILILIGCKILLEHLGIL